MAQAILVKYLPPTNTKGARLKAISWWGSLTVPYNHALNPPENRERAAHALCQKMGIQAALLGARLPRKLGHAFIMSPIEPLTNVKEP